MQLETFKQFKAQMDEATKDTGFKEWLCMKFPMTSLLQITSGDYVLGSKIDDMSPQDIICAYSKEAIAFRNTINFRRYMSEMYLDELCHANDLDQLETTFKEECRSYKNYHTIVFDRYLHYCVLNNEYDCDSDTDLPMAHPVLPPVLVEKRKLQLYGKTGAIYLGHKEKCNNCWETKHTYRTDNVGSDHQQCNQCGHIQKSFHVSEWNPIPLSWREQDEDEY